MKNLWRKKLLAMLAALSVTAASCAQLGLTEDSANEDNTTMLALAAANAVEALGINGSWSDNFGGSHEIAGGKSFAGGTSGNWKQTFSSGSVTNSSVVEFDNSSKTVYLKTPDEPNAFADCNGNGTKGETGVECYHKNVWTVTADGSTYYCQIVYNKASLADAKADTAQADASDPANSGCGGFSWTKLTKK